MEVVRGEIHRHLISFCTFCALLTGLLLTLLEMAIQAQLTIPFSSGEGEFLSHPRIATGLEGKYIYLLGNKVTTLQLTSDFFTFNLDLIDTMRGTRTRYRILPQHELRTVLGFYALSTHTVVLIDYNDEGRTIRQHVITLDPKTKTGAAVFTRSHPFRVLSAAMFCKISVSPYACYAFAPPAFDVSHMNGMRFPRDPRSTQLSSSFTSTLQEANRVLESRGRTISKWESPVCLLEKTSESSSERIVLFTDRFMSSIADSRVVVILDVKNGTFEMVDTHPDPITNFPFTKEGKDPYDTDLNRINQRSIGLLTTYRHSEQSWRGCVAKTLNSLIRLTWKLFFLSSSINLFTISSLCLQGVVSLTTAKAMIMRDRNARFGVLNTKTWQWCEMKGTAHQYDFYGTNVSGFEDGQCLLINKNHSHNTLNVRMVRNPFVIQSLLTLSNLASRNVMRMGNERNICLQAIGIL